MRKMFRCGRFWLFAIWFPDWWRGECCIIRCQYISRRRQKTIFGTGGRADVDGGMEEEVELNDTVFNIHSLIFREFVF